MPLFVRFGDRTYRDFIDLSRSEFYHKLATEKELPNTSQPTAQMFEEAFRPLVEAGKAVLCLTISSKLSGTINAARSAAQQFPGARIEVVDSETVAGGLRLAVLGARRMVQQGSPLEDVLAFLERARRTQRLYACIADLSHAVRTGRIGKAKAALGTLMKIVPVIALRAGEVVAEAQVRTMNRARETMIELAANSVADVASARFLVIHTNAPALAAQVQAALAARLGSPPKLLGLVEAGPVIATHGGPGAVGIFSAQE